VAFHSFDILANSSALLFGGNDLASSTPSGNDSAYLFNFPSTFSVAATSASALPTVGLDSAPTEPSRRMEHSVSSASNSRRVKGWLFGGLRSDGSGIAFADLWEYDASTDNTGSSAAWTLINGAANAPPALYGHTSTLVRGPDGVLRMYIIGGVLANNTLAPIGTIYVFTPDLSSDTSTGGSWTTAVVSGASGVQGRRGHVAVALSASQILVHGGASADGTNVLGDMFMIEIASNGDLSCSPVSTPSGPPFEARYSHTAATVGNVILMTFG
jgi:hypothetical protein